MLGLAVPKALTVPKKMVTGTFINNSSHKNAQKSSKIVKPTCTMLLAQGRISSKNYRFLSSVPVACIRFARYCGKIYSCILFP